MDFDSQRRPIAVSTKHEVVASRHSHLDNLSNLQKPAVASKMNRTTFLSGACAGMNQAKRGPNFHVNKKATQQTISQAFNESAHFKKRDLGLKAQSHSMLDQPYARKE